MTVAESVAPAVPEQQFARSAILFNTPWCHPAEGWAIASRAYARCMRLGGLDVVLQDWQRPAMMYDLHPEVEREVIDFLSDGRDAKLSLHIFSSALARAELMGVLDVMTMNAEPQAYYCVFERRWIEPELADKLNRLAGVMVQCRMNLRVLCEAGVGNVTLIPYPFFAEDPHLQIEKPEREPRRFYCVTRFEPRKAPDNIIRAFLRAFHPGESELVIKASPIPHSSPYPGAQQVVDEELNVVEVLGNGWNDENVWDNIQVVEGMLSNGDMLRLHAEGDVYVSASRGEGLELGAWAAKLAGRRLVATASGGPEDFLDPDVDICIPATGLVPADESYQWGPGATYVDYDLRELVTAMRRARYEPPCGTRTWPGWEEHRAERVAKKLRQWIEIISAA
jgi:glycosyltransferase involved in cell wall biosynthesis